MEPKVQLRLHFLVPLPTSLPHPHVNDTATRKTQNKTHIQMKKAVIRDRATHDLVISSLGKGSQVFGKVLSKRKRYDITKKIILLMKTWRLCAQKPSL